MGFNLFPKEETEMSEQKINYAKKKTKKKASRKKATPQLGVAAEEAPTTDEAALVDAAKVKEAAARAAASRRMIPPPSPGGAPSWVDIPAGFAFPRGKQFIFMRFKSSWTDTPWKGTPLKGDDGKIMCEYVTEEGTGNLVEKPILWRQCICWPLNVADKKLAVGRANGDVNRMSEELTKQMIRACDGEESDWALNGPQDAFWNEIGEKCRNLLDRMFNQLHMLNADETRDFLATCVAVRSGTG